ncbi:MAG: EcsC family protein, partial [Paracoccaceae bacterium]
MLPALAPSSMDTEIAALARAYRAANGPVMSLVNRMGGSLENQMALVPERLRIEIARVTETALQMAHGFAALGARAPDLGPGGTLAAV